MVRVSKSVGGSDAVGYNPFTVVVLSNLVALYGSRAG